MKNFNISIFPILISFLYAACTKEPEKININVVEHQGGSMRIRSEITYPFPILIIDKNFVFEYGYDADISEKVVDYGELHLFNKDSSYLWLKKDEFKTYVDRAYFGMFQYDNKYMRQSYTSIRWINISIPKRPTTEYQFLLFKDSLNNSGSIIQTTRTEISVKTNVVRTQKP